MMEHVKGQKNANAVTTNILKIPVTYYRIQWWSLNKGLIQQSSKEVSDALISYYSQIWI